MTSAKEIEIIPVLDEASIQRVESLAREIWPEHYTPIIGKVQIDYMLDQFQSRDSIKKQIRLEGFEYCLLKKPDGSYAGYLAVQSKKEAGELFLSKIYVRSADRGKGFGKKAMEWVEKRAKQLHLKKITLAVNKNNNDSIAAYRKMGFSVDRPILTDIGSGFFMDDYFMQKLIV